MSPVAPPLRRLIHAATTSIVIALGVAMGPTSLEVPAAYADDEAPVKAGSTLVARGDCEVQKVTITRGAKVQVTAATAKTADIALPDGYVLRRVPLSQLRYFFDVAR